MIQPLYKKAISLLLAGLLVSSFSVFAFPEQGTSNESGGASSFVSEPSSEPVSSTDSSEVESAPSSSETSLATSSKDSSFSSDNSFSSSPETSSVSEILSSAGSIHSVPKVSSQHTSSRSSQPTPTISPEWNENDELNAALNNACDWLKRNQEGTYSFLALGAAGKEIDNRRYETLINSIAKADPNEADFYDLIVWALNATFCGVSAENVRGTNLIELIANNQNAAEHSAETLALALLAYDSNQYQVASTAPLSRETVIDLLVGLQAENGSFPAQLQDSMLISTSLALTALSSYSDVVRIKNTLNQGLEYLRAEYENFSGDRISCQAFSQIIISLNSLGVNVNDSRFMKGKRTIDDLFLEFLGDDGGFKQYRSDKSSNVNATESAVIALVSIKYFSNPYRLRQTLNNVSSSSPDVSPPISDSVFTPVFWIVITACFAVVGGTFFIIWYQKKKQKEE